MPDSAPPAHDEAPERQRLRNRRPGLVETLEWEGRQLLATFGVDRDGRVREVFFSGALSGSHFDGLLSDIGVVVSIALQYGVPLAAFAESVGWAAQNDPADPSGPGPRKPISPLGEALVRAAELEARDRPLLAAASRLEHF